MVKVIKTDAEYRDALADLDQLLLLNPAPNTPEGDQLELLALVIEEYESKTYHFDLPDPVDAIQFRMEQQGLTQRDLIPYLGSRSKVSEVLARKRPLTLAMIRALHAGLDIPAHVLLQETMPDPEESSIDWSRFPITEMSKRGWIQASGSKPKNNAESILRDWFGNLGAPVPVIQAALYRKSSHVRSERTMDEYALAAWTARVLMRAKDEGSSIPYMRGTVNLEFMKDIAKLSVQEDGPLAAREFLRQHGIALIIERHLPRTHLDGAAILSRTDQNPVIGLSLRYDRTDNFWFCLLHELAHVSLHFDGEFRFYDDLDLVEQNDKREREADELAGEALIPEAVWRTSPASRLRSPDAAESLARKLQISPAIVAGRMRHEFKAYRLLNNLVGHGEVRRLFPQVDWSK